MENREISQRKKDKLSSEFPNECSALCGNDTSKLKTLGSHFISAKALNALMKNDLNELILARADRFTEVLKERLVGD